MNNTEDEIWSILDDLNEDEYVKEHGERETKIVCLCGCDEFIIEDAMQICSKCSSICSKVIDNTAEWRYYGSDSKNDDPSRCGLPTNALLPKSSLGSMIGGNKYGNNYDIRRIRKFIAWNSMPYNERTLWLVFDVLTSNSLSNGIPQKVVDDAKVLYKNASEKKISRGDNKEGLIASCIYHSCLLNNIPRSSKEIAKMFNINPVILNKGNTRFQTLLQINVVSSSPIDFISRYCCQLNMKLTDIDNCKRLILFLEENEIMSDNSPTSSCAAILYYYSEKNKLGYNKKQFADICNVSEVTVIKGYKTILKYDNFINSNFNND